jgi:hypothetical protein
MRKTLLVFTLAMVVGACATTKTMQAIGGSRSDGIVRLAYEEGMFEKAKVDPAAAIQTARERCKVWGYTDAEPFGGVVRQCQQMSGYGCAQTLVTVEFQCTGANTPS